MKAGIDHPAVARALARLARPNATLSPLRGKDGFGVFAAGDRRGRAQARIPADIVAILAREGALSRQGDDFLLSSAGRARIGRASAAPQEAWRAQHEALVDRAVMDRDGAIAFARGLPTAACAARLARVKDGAGAAFFAPAELAAAARLAADGATGAEGLLRGSDWQAPPRGGAPRGGGGGVEAARAKAVDARARVAAALDALAPQPARIVRAAVLEDAGLEIIERREQWPARSAKVALKFALAQLAQHYAKGRRAGFSRG